MFHKWSTVSVVLKKLDNRYYSSWVWLTCSYTKCHIYCWYQRSL